MNPCSRIRIHDPIDSPENKKKKYQKKCISPLQLTSSLVLRIHLNDLEILYHNEKSKANKLAEVKKRIAFETVKAKKEEFR